MEEIKPVKICAQIRTQCRSRSRSLLDEYLPQLVCVPI